VLSRIVKELTPRHQISLTHCCKPAKEVATLALLIACRKLFGGECLVFSYVSKYVTPL